MSRVRKASRTRQLPKCQTGIRGLDHITNGGLPRGRPTLVCGGAGTGKTLLGIEFLVRGAMAFGEPGVFVTFEERGEDIVENVASLGFDLDDLVSRELLMIEQIVIDRSEILESGEYNLDGLFIRLKAAIERVGAKRIVLDTIESLFAALANEGILRAELRRLFGWLKEIGITALVTGERGAGALTRHGLEEYVSDCVVVLDQRITDQISTRRLRIAKYRGSTHGTNEYPFLIEENGIVVLPITSVVLNYSAPGSFVSTGVPKLDAMFEGKGCYRGSTIMVSGSAGSGKTSLAAHFADAACRRGEKCAYFGFEESPAQIARNMRSISLDLDRWITKGLLRFSAVRPTTVGLETHISLMLRLVEEFEPRVVIVDPASSFESAGGFLDARGMLMRLIDLLKSREITTVLTSLTGANQFQAEDTGVGVSSLIDTWILVRNIEQAGERTRGLTVLKARGLKHSNQIRELLITDQGLDLRDIYVGPEGMLVGAARLAQEMKDRAAIAASRHDVQHRKDQLTRKRRALKAKVAELEAEYAAEAHEIEHEIASEIAREQASASGRTSVAAQLRAQTASRVKPQGDSR